MRLRELVPRHTRARVARRLGEAAATAAAPLDARGALTHRIIRDYCAGRGVEVGPGTSPYRQDATLIDRHAAYLGDRVVTNVVADGAALPLRSGSHDYVLSAHCLEHQHDTLAALREWVRILRPGGHLVLILPHVDRTFDRGRPVADLEHHQAEEGLPLDPASPPHWDDFERWSLSVDHEWMSDPAARDGAGWDRRWLVERGLVHYHAWTQAEMAGIVASLLHLVAVVERLPDRADSFLVVGRAQAVRT